jgi:protein phosphatase 1B
LEHPKTEKDTEEFVSKTGLVCGGSGMQGYRIEMEDSHISVDMPSKPDHLFLGVWDGHAGAGAAKYASEKMVGIIEATQEWQEYITKEEDPELLGRALIKAFLQIDVDMRAYQGTTGGQDTSGCTSVTAMVTPKHIICSNAGDSRCVMGVPGGAKPLSFDHKPVNPLERERIDSAGGFVQWNRVDGDLAVSRALGDFGYKTRPDLPAEMQKVSPCPEITIHVRAAADDVLLLACDGLWDVMSNDEAVALLREVFESGEDSVPRVAEEMLDVSLDKGSKDNISAMVVLLPGAAIGPKEGGGVLQRRADRAAAVAGAAESNRPGGQGPPL